MNKAIDYLDEQLGRVTMYRLVVYGLAAIALMAFVLMVSGYLPYAPGSFALSLGLCVGIAYGANRLFGWLFGVRPHSESAVITGLILSLLFLPPVSLVGAVQLVLVATIAMASKYVIVFRGRHLFNPAALAIVLASLTGLAYAGWWVATPALLPVTAVAAFLILFKTKRLQMGLVFLVVAAAVIVVRTALVDTLTVQSVVAALTSWPLVFFAGVMICEPLTLPPRHREQMAEAALVGFLLGSALHISVISITPGVALLIGNALGWYWGTRGAIKLRLMSKKQMGQGIYEFTFDSNKPRFVPGQYVEMTLPHRHADSRGMRRVFSIVGEPGSEHLSIGTRIPQKPSSFKRALQALKPGQVVYGTRIAGDFVLPEDKSVPVVLIAGGIGVTPYISHIMAAGKRDVRLIYAVSAINDLAYVEFLKQYEIDVTIVSPDAAPLPDPAWHHIKAPFVTPEIIGGLIGQKSRPLVYISGPPAMVNATKRAVAALGLPYKTDHFAGY